MLNLKNVTCLSVGFGSYTVPTLKTLQRVKQHIKFDRMILINDIYNCSNDDIEKVISPYINTNMFYYPSSSVRCTYSTQVIKMIYSTYVLQHLLDEIDIQSDYVMFIQWDGFPINVGAWKEEFLQYDYIGSPWYIEGRNGLVGNGGFSIRSRKLMEWCRSYLDLHSYTNTIQLYNKEQKIITEPEDNILCIHERKNLENEGFVFAPTELANQFSIESHHRGYSGQFGFHMNMNENITTLPVSIKEFLHDSLKRIRGNV